MITIAHLTDIHLGPIAGFSPRYWNIKRATGFINWHRGRKTAHRQSALDRIVADMRAHAPDHIAVTGDLANIGLPAELAAGLAWLTTLGMPERVTVVPGNHDIYSTVRADVGVGRWADYMTSDTGGAAYVPVEPGLFPFVRRVGDVAIVGLNSAIATPPLVAAGALGAGQRDRLAPLLERLRSDGLFRLILIHHPPLPGQASAARGLRDAKELAAILTRHGAELVIHGHNHRAMLAYQSSLAGDIPVVGAPSASLSRAHHGEQLARYNLYRIDPADGPRIEMIGRGLAEPDGPVIELERQLLLPHR